MKKLLNTLFIVLLLQMNAFTADDEKLKFQSAVLSDQHITVERMLKSGFKADTIYDRGETALLMAALYRKARMAELLIKYGADVNRSNTAGETPLINACGTGTDFVKKSTTAADKLAVIKILLNAGADVNAQTKTIKRTPLLCAASDGKNTQQETLQLLLDAGADINHKGLYGETALILAASNIRYDLVSYLLSKGADIKGVNTVAHGATPLIAVLEGDTGDAVHFSKRQKKEVLESRTKTVKLLLEKGADVNFLNKLQENAVHLTVRFIDESTPAILRLLKEYGADFSRKDHLGKTPMSVVNDSFSSGYITKKQHQEITRLLKELGAQSEAVSGNMTQLLIGAVTRNSRKEIDEYLSGGADINGEGESGDTPLRAAISSEHAMNLVSYLVSRGADINKPMKAFGCSAFIYIASHGGSSSLRYMGYIDLYRFMLKNGAGINDSDKDGRTPLMFAASGRDIEALRLLLPEKPDLNRKDRNGKTALMIAFENRADKPVVELLLNAGCDIHIRDSGGRTALMYAVLSDDAAAMRCLVEKGAGLEDKDSRGMTPLMFAAADYPSTRTAAVVKYLLSKGAHSGAKDNEGRTALDHARKSLNLYKGGSSETAEILEKHIK